MSSSYSSLRDYNEVFARKKIVLQEDFKEKYPCELMDCGLEGYFFEPPVETSMSANLFITVLSKGIMYYCKLRTPPDPSNPVTRLFFQFTRANQEEVQVDLALSPQKQIVSKGFLRYNTRQFPINRIDFQAIVNHNQFYTVLCTTENLDGELAGTCQVIL